MGYYYNLSTGNAKLSYEGTQTVAIYAFSLVKFLDVRKYACVKDLTYIMSEIFIPTLFRSGHFQESRTNLSLFSTVIPLLFPFRG